MLCLKFEYNFPQLYIVMIPIWLLLISLIIYIGGNLLPKSKKTQQRQQQHQQRQQQQARPIVHMKTTDP